MSGILPLKKLVVELRYMPDLGFYGKMDAFGLELALDFPDWERSPLTLELRNKKKHRRLYLSVKRAFFDVDDANANGDYGYAEKLLGKVCPKLGVKEFGRVGVRQWFAADLNKPFALMVDEFSERFLPKSKEMAIILGDKARDVAYVVDYETEEGWRYNLRMGPMMKSQWFLGVGHEAANFEYGDDAVETFDKYQKSFPEQFLYLDIDCYQEKQPADKLDKLLSGIRRRSHDLAEKLIEYSRK